MKNFNFLSNLLQRVSAMSGMKAETINYDGQPAVNRRANMTSVLRHCKASDVRVAQEWYECGARVAREWLKYAVVIVMLFTIGSGNVWAQTTTTYTFSSKSWATSTANWTSGKDGNQMQSGRGIQVTTGTSGANGTSPKSFTNVSKVVVTYSTNTSAGAGSIAVKIGSNTASSQNVTTQGGTTDRTLTYNFSPNQTGSVIVTVTCTTNSIYVKSVAITEAASCTSITPSLSYASVGGTTLTVGNSSSGSPTITGNTGSGTVTYSSNNTNVARVNSSTGVVTAVAAGNATITASIAAQGVYCEGSATANFTITVPAYTVQFSTGTGNPTVSSRTEASGGAGITLPAGPTPACSGDGWVFFGWKETSAQSSSTTAPDVLAAGMTYKPASNCTLYAVYYKQADSNPNYYTKVTTSSDNLTSGQYVIYANGEAMNNALTGSKIAGKSVSETSSGSGIISTTDADIIWTLYKNGTNYQLYNAGVSKYLEVTGENSLSLPTSSKGFTLKAFNTSTGQVSLKSVNKTSYEFQYYSGNFSAYGSQSTAIYFYKRGGTYNSNPTCCTQYTVTRSGSPAGTVTGGTFTIDKESACEGATVTLTATPSANYRFNSWTISKAAGTVSPVDASSASTTFTMPGEAVTVTASFTAKCQTPTFNVAAGTYNNDQTVTISCATAGVTIKYTTDGRDPATYGTTYSAPVTINADNTTLKAVAIKAGHENSEVASATYRLKCATPTFTPTPGLVDSKYLGTQSVAFNTTTTGSITFYYTTDGSTTPTTSSTEYSSAIDVSSTTTLKAIATKANYQNSDVATQTFTITNAYTVTWMNRGSLLTTTRVEEGEKPTFPTTAKTGCDTYTSFYGWANNTWNGGKTTIAAPPVGLAAYTTSSTMPDVDGDVTYHAVWTNSFRDIHTSNVSLPGSAPSYGVLLHTYVDNESYDSHVYYNAVKMGTTNNACSFTITVPANTTYLSLHGCGWQSSTNASVTISGPDGVSISPATATVLQANSHATGNLTSSSNVDCYGTWDFVEYTLDGVGNSSKTLTITQSGSQIIIWGINSATASGSPKYITSCCTPVSDRNAAVTAYDDESVTVRWDAVDNISSWAIVAKRTSDASTTGISIGDITTPTTGKRQCVISGLQPNTGYTITINGTAASGYCDTSDELTQTTTCATPSPSITQTVGTPDLCAGQAFTLSCSGGATGATYQWKRNGSNIGGATNSTYAVASATRANAGTYTCTVTNPGSGSCTATSGDYSIKVWTLYINNGDADAFQHVNFTNTGTGTGSNTTVFLTSDKGYEFKVNNGYEESGNWYGNPGTITTDVSNWVFAGDKGNCKLTSGIEGNYTFSINYSSSSSPTVSVSYPHADQPNNRSIWFDKSVVTGWNSEGTSDLYYRIGKSTNHTNNTKTGGTAWTLVPGTDKFYTTKTMAYDGFEAWAISNNAAWCADADDNHSIYGNATDGYKITKAIDFQKYVVGASGVTIVPTAYHNTDGNSCDYWSVTKTDGMLTHTATITTPTNGTITISNTDQSLSETTTTADLPHRTILTVTATPAPGYQLSSLTVNGDAFTSGNEHILSADATIAATFTAKTITITWDGNGGNTPSPTESSYTYNGSTVSLATVTHATKLFAGWFTDPSAGTQITEIGTTNKPTADVTYYAHWVDGNTVIFHPGVGSVTPASVTQTSIGGAVDIPTPIIDCDGWSFAGWNIGSTLAETTTNPEASLQAAGSAAYVPASATVHMYAVWKKNFGGGTGDVTATYDWDANTTGWSVPVAVSTQNSGGNPNKCGQFGTNSDLYIQFSTKVAVTAFSCDICRNSGNDNGTVMIEYSSNGSTWTEKTSSGIGSFPNGSWENSTFSTTFDGENNYYVRFHYKSTGNAARKIDNMSITYTGTIPDSYKWTSSANDYGCTPANQVKTPLISPDTEAQTGDVSVTITCATDDATIRYTTDGTDPTSSSGTVYSGAFTVSCSATVKAIAYKAEMDDSEIASQAYTITVPTPTFSLPAGTYYDANQSVTLSLPTAHTGTVIKYTTNGDDPTSSSATYSSAITVTEGTTTIKAIGYNSTCGTSSSVASATYIVRFGTDYTLVTDANDLMAGDQVVIISADAGTSSKYAISTTISSNKRTSTNDYNINAGLTTAKIYPALGAAATVQVFTLGGEPGAWTFHETTNNGYLNCPSAGKLTNTATVSNSNKWTIAIASNIATIHNNDVDATIKSNTASGHVFAAYAPATENVQLVKLYSIPNPDPVIKIDADLSAFSACRGSASDYQSFYISGKNLDGSIVLSNVAPLAGYEFCLTSGGTYTATLELTPVSKTVAKTQVFVRLAAGATAGTKNGNLNAAVSANSLSTNIAVTGSVSTADTYTDQIHNTVVANQCGEYLAPSCPDASAPADESCVETHFKFMGWITEADKNASGVKDDAWYIAHLVTAGTAMTADGTNYYAVWAKEED